MSHTFLYGLHILYKNKSKKQLSSISINKVHTIIIYPRMIFFIQRLYIVNSFYLALKT